MFSSLYQLRKRVSTVSSNVIVLRANLQTEVVLDTNLSTGFALKNYSTRQPPSAYDKIPFASLNPSRSSTASWQDPAADLAGLMRYRDPVKAVKPKDVPSPVMTAALLRAVDAGEMLRELQKYRKSLSTISVAAASTRLADLAATSRGPENEQASTTKPLEQEELVAAVSLLLELMETNLIGAGVRELSTCLFSLAKISERGRLSAVFTAMRLPPAFARVADRMAETLRKTEVVSPRSLTSALWACGVMREKPEALLDVVSEMLIKIAEDPKSALTCVDLSLSITGCSHMNLRNRRLLDALTSRLAAATEATPHLLSNVGLAGVMSALARLNHAHITLSKVLVQEAIRRRKTMRPIDAVEVLRSTASMSMIYTYNDDSQDYADFMRALAEMVLDFSGQVKTAIMQSGRFSLRTAMHVLHSYTDLGVCPWNAADACLQAVVMDAGGAGPLMAALEVSSSLGLRDLTLAVELASKVSSAKNIFYSPASAARMLAALTTCLANALHRVHETAREAEDLAASINSDSSSLNSDSSTHSSDSSLETSTSQHTDHINFSYQSWYNSYQKPPTKNNTLIKITPALPADLEKLGDAGVAAIALIREFSHKCSQLLLKQPLDRVNSGPNDTAAISDDVPDQNGGDQRTAARKASTAQSLDNFASLCQANALLSEIGVDLDLDERVLRYAQQMARESAAQVFPGESLMLVFGTLKNTLPAGSTVTNHTLTPDSTALVHILIHDTPESTKTEPHLSQSAETSASSTSSTNTASALPSVDSGKSGIAVMVVGPRDMVDTGRSVELRGEWVLQEMLLASRCREVIKISSEDVRLAASEDDLVKLLRSRGLTQLRLPSEEPSSTASTW